MNTTLLEQFYTVASDGYLGAIKTTGSKSVVYLRDAELSKQIRQALQEVLAPELSKSDVKVRKESYSMGRTIHITLRLDKSKYAPTREEYKQMVIDNIKRGKYTWIKKDDEDSKGTFHEAYRSMTEDEKRKAEQATAEQQAVWNYDRDTTDINQYHIDNEEMLNDEGKEIVRVANQVVKAFNYDDSNAQVDYFDTNFYYNLKVEWK
jgi:hypothetical protein